MSNTPSTPVVQRIQPSTLLFIVLIFALGALILAATNIDPNSAVRGNIKYTFWTSPDGSISLEYPADWVLVSSAGSLEYTFLSHPQDTQNTQRALITLSTDDTAVGQGLETTFANKVSKIMAPNTPDFPIEPQTALVGGLKGIAASWAVTLNDPSGANPPLTQYQSYWLAALDNSHFLTGELLTLDPATDGPKWAHSISTLHVNKEAALKALGVTATPEATSAATASGTEAATAGATAQGTASAAPAATQAATP